MFYDQAVKMSNETRADLIAAIGKAVQAFQDATDSFDEAAAARLGINRTDLRCLGVVAARGPVSVGEIGRAVDLTRGAATTALDRVERAGYVRRIRNPEDRRGVLIVMTDAGRAATGAIWAPMVAAGDVMLSRYSLAELRTILRFLEESRQAQLDELGQGSQDPTTG